ncbi:MAG: hypothetical protein GX896_07905 [Clostridiales bacterium]|nr:hypothetical protein [Clostridiales bacterium]
MTATQIIETVNQLKPNSYSEDFMVQWLNEIEGMIFDEVIKPSKAGKDKTLIPINPMENPEQQLLAPDNFAQMYTYYLMAKIDFSDCETGRYNNDIAMFNSEYSSFCAWYNRNFPPNEQMGIRV